MASVKKIKFDTTLINECASSLQNLNNGLRDAKNKLQSAMADVKDGWQGKGAVAFDKLLTEDWSEGLDRYCELLELLVQIVNEAAATYNQMATDIKGLDYQG